MAVVALVGALLVTSGSDDSPVSVSAAQLQVDTAALGNGRMAVVIGDDLYVADGPTGQVWQLTDVDRGDGVSHVSFSHDGEWVAFTSHDEGGLWVSRWDGSEHHRVGRAPDRYSWSPTDDQLAFATDDQVRVAQTDGSSRALEGGPPPQPSTNVVWSPDGASLAFAQSDYGMGMSQAIIATLADEDGAGWGSPYQYSVSDAEEVVAWTPDEKLVVTAGAEDGTGTTALAVGLLLSVETVELVEVPRIEPPPVAVSASGYAAAVRPVGEPGLDLCDLVELTCQRQGVGTAYDRTSVPSFSPQGDAVALVGTDVDGRTVVTVVAPAGSTHPTLGVVGEGLALTDPPERQPRFGSVLEPPQWIDERHLLVRAGRRVSVVELGDTGGAVPATVVEGERFLPPEDDHPGGTGLAYWAPS